MQKTTKLLVAAAVPSMLMATNLFAGLSASVDLPPSGYRDPNSVGGEFTAVVTGGPNYAANYYSGAKTSTGFETFCVEMTTSFSTGSSYNATVGSSIVSSSGSTPLSAGVAWLYMEFATGGLAGNTFGLTSADYNYATSGTGKAGETREYMSDELQDAIWYLEGEITSSTSKYTSGGKLLYSFTTADPFLKLVEDEFGGSLTTAEESDAIYKNNFGVQVLNLYTVNQYGQTVYAQDQLVYCPVPEPATFAAGALLLAPLGLAAFRASRKKS
jgi:hypothetical protein